MFFSRLFPLRGPSPEELQKQRVLQNRLSLHRVTAINVQELDTLVRMDRPVLMLYWSKTCGACVDLWKSMRGLAKTYPDVAFVSVVAELSEKDHLAMRREGFTRTPSLQFSWGTGIKNTLVMGLDEDRMENWLANQMKKAGPRKTRRPCLLEAKP